MADIPAGTGLGSSGSFTTALLKALYAHRRHLIHPQELAELACHIEIDRLGEPDWQAGSIHCCLRWLNLFYLPQGRQVTAVPLKVSAWTRCSISKTTSCCSLRVFPAVPAAFSRIRKTRTQNSDDDMLKNLHFVKELGYRSKDALEAGDVVSLAS